MRWTFLHAADIHLDSPLLGLSRYQGAPVERFRDATRAALRRLVDLALDEEPRFVLIAGDLYDGPWRGFDTGLFFAAELGRLRQAGIRVFLAHGNHDAESRLTRRLALPENVGVFAARKPETFRLEGEGVALHGQSFARQHVEENLARDYPAPEPGVLNIGVLHTALEGNADHATYAPCTAEELAAKGYDYWALGHIHAAATIRRDPWIVFCGNLQGRHARETGAKGCLRVTVENGRIVSVEPVSCDAARWAVVALDLDGVSALADVPQRAEAALRDAAAEADGRPLAVRLRLIGETGAAPELLAAAPKLEAELRAMAVSLGADLCWLEKIEVDARLPDARRR
ncbi:MAG: DNA repair exonuclease [Pseudomonadota bacterium]|nr:DNA repair exonuclease [Pseudomonadota bacterium]